MQAINAAECALDYGYSILINQIETAGNFGVSSIPASGSAALTLPSEATAFLNGGVTLPSGSYSGRTGSIVLNQSVTLGPCAVAHGNLSVSISSTPQVSQPNALSPGGQTVVTEKTNIQIRQEPGALMVMAAGPQLADVVRALNSLGATPLDLLAILQAIKAAGALNAELEVI